MVKGKRTIAGFDDVSDNNINVNDDAKDNTDAKDNIDDIIGNYETKKSNKKGKELHGLYLDADVKETLISLKKKYGRGFQSELANAAIRKALIEKGLLK